jgi:hypothetical protein
MKPLVCRGLRPGDNSVEAFAYHRGDVLHGRDARTHDIGALLPEHGGDYIDLLAVEDCALAADGP